MGNSGLWSPDPEIFPCGFLNQNVANHAPFTAIAIKLWTFVPEQHIKYPIICFLAEASVLHRKSKV